MKVAHFISPGGIAAGAGGLVIVLAAISFGTEMPLEELFSQARQVFGWGFVSVFSLLLVVAVVAFGNLKNSQKIHYWHELGQQAGNGIATLSLTFTLLGISLGIGSLSEQTLNPDSINQIIAALTAQFSMAFMTTVVGLPTATLIRAMMAVRYQSVRHQSVLPGSGD